jgi:signal transduction histidine kinase
MVPEALSRQLLDSVGARIIVLKMRGTRRLLAATQMPLQVDEIFDLRRSAWMESIFAAFRTLTAAPGRVITVLGDAPMGGDAVEITMDEAPLKKAMHDFSVRILLSSLIVTAIVAGAAIAALHLMVLRPVRRLTTSLIKFGDDPENAARIIRPSGSKHEIGRAEEALSIMQDALVRELNQKKHLAALGLAVAKINHDLRNMLASAQLLSDRLADLSDPLAQRLAPKLVATLDRAIRFCQATLTYGRAIDDPPKLRPLALRSVAAEAIETIALADHGKSESAKIEFVNEIAEDFIVAGDGEQLFRVFLNLFRNGVEALERAGPAPGQPARITIEAKREYSGGDATAVIEVADTGPGVPETARAKLFTAFSSSSRPGGSGLGLAIAADLIRAHGGTIILVTKAAEDEAGARFRITLPLQPVDGAR